MLTSAVSAAERPRRTISTESVRTDDLDLNTVAGARQMFRRIKGAAERACDQPSSGLFPWVAYENWRCRRQATAQAVRGLNAPLVTATYAYDTDTPRQNLAAR
jgi:UrcA family protein